MAKVEVPQAERLTLLQAAALPGEFLELGVASGHSGAIESCLVSGTAASAS